MATRLALLLFLACAAPARAADSFNPDTNKRGDGSALTPGEAANLLGPLQPGTGTGIGGGGTGGGRLSNPVGGALTAAGNNPPAGARGGAPGGSAPGAPGGTPASAPAISPFGAGSELAIKAGVELQLGDLVAACETARAALARDPKDAKALKIESLACRGELSGGPKAAPGEGLAPAPAGRDVALDLNKKSKLLRGDQSGALAAPMAGALQAWIARAAEAKESGDDQQVVQLCDEGLREFPGNLLLLNAKGTAQDRLKDFKGALATANEALELDAKNAVAHANKAFALGGLGDREGMLAALREAAALDPRFESALKAALAADAAGLFDAKALGGKALPKSAWIAIPAFAGFVGMLILVLLARRAAPRPAPAPAFTGPIAPRTIGSGDVLGGNFRVDGELGRGGMGVVFSAFDEKLERRVAIKQLQRGAGATAGDLERFLREARLVAQLKHPNLAEIYTVLEEYGEQLLVFEFVDGRTLDKVIYAYRKVPLPLAAKVLGEIASALDYAHGRKIIHRDLKPSNVMIARDGAVKVMDFGIAHQASGAAAATKTAASGTPPYMAPEQALGSVSKASDLYALGVMAYEMVSGVRPFDGPDFLEQKLRMAYTPAARRDAALPAALDAFFASALEADPTKRPASGADFHRAFVSACG